MPSLSKSRSIETFTVQVVVLPLMPTVSALSQLDPVPLYVIGTSIKVVVDAIVAVYATVVKSGPDTLIL